MAWFLTVTVHDDLDGGAADETVEFCLDGTSYQIDLSTAHATALRDLLAIYVARARSSPGGFHRPAAGNGEAAAGGMPQPLSETAVVRSWAKANGFAVSRVGRLPTEVARAYAQATRGLQNATGIARPPATAPFPSLASAITDTTSVPTAITTAPITTATGTAPDQISTMEEL